jgi:O-antigen chain-terminating methyltransferase
MAHENTSDKHIDSNIPEMDIDQLMENIRKEVRIRHGQGNISGIIAEPESRTQPGNNVPCIDTSVIKSFITNAEAMADAGAEVTPMHQFRGLARSTALLTGRAIVYLLRFITDKQRRFNNLVIQALRGITDDLESLQKNRSAREDMEQLVKEQAKVHDAISGISRLESIQRESDKQIRGLQMVLSQKDIQIQELKEEIQALLARNKNPQLESLYLSFENKFRGTREDIKERSKEFLPFIIEAGAGTEEFPLLDLGCGRGEWLEVLRENSRIASGVDTNRDMILYCKKKGIVVFHEDCLKYLMDQARDSLGAVTGFHFLEHLDFNTIISVLKEVLRVLKPGGIAIFETPNPENILVGCSHFYLDPTHKKPLPSPLLKFLAETLGFHDVNILNLHPFPETHKLSDSDIADRFNELFYGPQDYAVIAYKA